MAVQFTMRDPETGAPVEVDHYSLTDTARRFHTSRDFIKRGVDAGRFPCLRIGSRYWFSEADMAALYAALHVDPAGPTPPPRRLGTVVADPDTALRGVR
jgi:hypothetical protein